jgi:hypothetical protein
VARLPSGRAIFVAPTIIQAPVEAMPRRVWSTSNLATAAPQIIRIGERATPGARTTLINGSSPALRPESGPKIIRIER